MALTAEQRAALRERNRRRRARGKAPPLRKVPLQALPDTTTDRHARELRRLANRLFELVDRLLLPALPELLGRSDANLDQDGDSLLDRLLRSIGRLFAAVVGAGSVGRRAGRNARLVNGFNRTQVNHQFQRVLSIDLQSAEPFVAAQIDDFIADNTGLITKMGAEQLELVGRIVRDAQRQRTRVEVVRDRIEARLGVARSRATLIARDQIAKLNSQLTQARQRQHGVEGYTWRTSRDERVRPGHARLEGQVYRWDDPPIVDEPTGRRAHPGEDFQCRCTPEPIFEQIAAFNQPQPVPDPTPTLEPIVPRAEAS
jgi:SPP1 gp7 family putative phage head morphogenesis protein